MIFTLTACGSSAQDNTTENTNTSGSVEEPSTKPADATESEDNSQTDAEGSNILVAYFSLAGEQYSVGTIDEGNTGIIAHMIAEQTGADLFEIEAGYNSLHDVNECAGYVLTFNNEKSGI